MKVIFAEARSKERLSEEIIKELAFKLPKRVSILASVQYLHQAKELEKYLKSKGKITLKAKNALSCYQNQILGCDISGAVKIKDKIDAFLILGSKFHSILTALKTEKPVFYYSDGKIEKITDKEISQIKIKQKTALIKFYSLDKIGILVSTKPGQEKLKLAEKIRQKLEKMNKQGIIFITNNIDLSEFENFQIPLYINTACPTIIYDSNKIINYSDIPELN
jgi:2-(3-amino-3-carboxypropyl)histidine synthase